MATGDKDANDKSLVRVTVVDLGQLVGPASALIEKISNAIGGIYKPFQIVRVAKAEAEAELIRANAQIEITDLHRRAMLRFVGEEAKKQANIEAITQEALPLLEDQSSPEKVEDDWITSFFDKCRSVSDTEMQRLWARVLAGEANEPGHFSRKTINLVADLNKRDAELFTRLCRCNWVVGDVVPLVFPKDFAVAHQFDISSIYVQYGITFDVLTHLHTLGLIVYNGIQTYGKQGLPARFMVFYFGRPLALVMKPKMANLLDTGQVILTKAGRELARFCGATPIDGFYDLVAKHWKAKGLIPETATETSSEAGPQQVGG
ncbi:MAG: DUF2806 domain-containing protein [Thermoguttaceae bacterium]|jgi:hypothetical protein